MNNPFDTLNRFMNRPAILPAVRGVVIIVLALNAGGLDFVQNIFNTSIGIWTLTIGHLFAIVGLYLGFGAWTYLYD